MQIPLIDCCTRSRSEQSIARDIDSALSAIGFMAVHNLGIPSYSVESLFATSRRFFSTADDQAERIRARCAYRAAEENFGYQGVLAESLDPQSPADLKEAFTMRNLLATEIPKERWPDAEFRREVTDFYRLALEAARRLQRLLAMALDLPDDFFLRCHTGENTTLRLLHYPRVSSSAVVERQMGAGAHTDYGMLTLLFQDEVGGLQVRSDADEWIDVPPLPESIVINSGDLLERWSNGRYRSTLHRVLPRCRGGDRYSVALFVDPDSATRVEVLPSCVSEENPPRYAPTTAGQHLQERIRATHRH